MAKNPKFVKILQPFQSSELLFLNSVSHPSIIYLSSFRVDENCQCHLEFPRGDLVNNLSDKEIIEIIKVLWYLEKMGIVYGDLKTENMVRLDGKIKLIDFGILNFPLTCVNNQTFGDPTSTLDPIKNLIWAIGVMIFRNLVSCSFRGKIAYNNFVFLKSAYLKINKTALGKWFPIVEICLKDVEDRPSSILEILNSLNVEYLDESLSFSVMPLLHSNKVSCKEDYWCGRIRETDFYPEKVMNKIIELFQSIGKPERDFAIGSMIIVSDFFGYNISKIKYEEEWELRDFEWSNIFEKTLEEIQFTLPKCLLM